MKRVKLFVVYLIFGVLLNEVSEKRPCGLLRFESSSSLPAERPLVRAVVGPELLDVHADAGRDDLRHNGWVCDVDLHLALRFNLFTAQPRERGLARQKRAVDLVGFGVHEHSGDHAGVVLRGDREHPEQVVLPLGCDRSGLHDPVGEVMSGRL